MKDLGNKLQRKSSEIKVLLDCREKLESRLNVMEDERKRQHDHLVEMKANLAEALDQQYKTSQGYDKIQQELLRNKELLALEEMEVSGLQKEREALLTEISTMREEIECRKLEVSRSSWNVYELNRYTVITLYQARTQQFQLGGSNLTTPI